MVAECWPEDRLGEFHDAHAASFTRTNFLVTAVDGVIELIEALSVVAILAPLTGSRQEAVLAFERSNDDPHSVFQSLAFLVWFRNSGDVDRQQPSAFSGISDAGMRS